MSEELTYLWEELKPFGLDLLAEVGRSLMADPPLERMEMGEIRELHNPLFSAWSANIWGPRQRRLFSIHFSVSKAPGKLAAWELGAKNWGLPMRSTHMAAEGRWIRDVAEAKEELKADGPDLADKVAYDIDRLIRSLPKSKEWAP